MTPIDNIIIFGALLVITAFVLKGLIKYIEYLDKKDKKDA